MDVYNNQIIQLSGDQRDNIKQLLISLKVAEKNQIKIHGAK